MITSLRIGPSCCGGRVYKFFLSLRFIRSRIISYLAILFTALGIAILVIVVSVMAGFGAEFRKSLRAFHSHITVDSEFYYGVRSEKEIIQEIEKVPEVVAAAPFIENLVLISGITKDWGKLKGIDPKREVEVSEIQALLLSPREIARQLLKKEFGEAADIEELFGEELAEFSEEVPPLDELLRSQKSPFPALIVGSEILYRFRIPLHDRVTLLTTSAREVGNFKGVDDAEKQEFEVVGAFETGNWEIDRRFCYCLLEDAQDFIGVGRDQLTGIAVRLEDHEDADRVRASLIPMTYGFPDENLRILTWHDLNKALLQAVRLEKWLISAIILFVLCLVSALIVAILTMSVVEKTRDIGILRALGATGGGIMTIFLSQGLLIGSIGGTVGLGAGLIFVRYINEMAAVVEKVTGYHPFPKKIYYLDEIPVHVDISELVTLVAIVLLVSFFLSLFPAAKAVRLHTVRALRYE